MGTRGRLLIGCSGWQYASWRGRFYPTTGPTSDWLRLYAARFESVEINSTFYRLPERPTFVAWRKQLPDGFVAAVKASRYLTHLKRLKDPAAPVARLFSRVTALGRHLGPVLYQLPGTFNYRPDHVARLRDFLDVLPKRRALRHVIEFRDASWYRDDVFRVVTAAGVAICWHDMAGSALHYSPNPFVYVRFHGSAGKYRGSYDRRVLARSAAQLTTAIDAGFDGYAYFNNDIDGAAIRNAETLLELCGRR